MMPVTKVHANVEDMLTVFSADTSYCFSSRHASLPDEQTHKRGANRGQIGRKIWWQADMGCRHNQKQMDGGSQEEESLEEEKQVETTTKKMLMSSQNCMDVWGETELYIEATQQMGMYMETDWRRFVPETGRQCLYLSAASGWCRQRCDDGDVTQRCDGTANRLTLTGPC